MGDKINSITVGELFLIMGGCVAIYTFCKSIIIPFVNKWLKIEDNSKKIKGLPELVAAQRLCIDVLEKDVSELKKDVSDLKTELASNNVLLKSMDMKLEILVSAQMGAHQSEHDIVLLDKAYKDKKLEQLKK